MRPKLTPTPKIFGQPKSITEANQITSQSELNTIVHWRVKCKGYLKSGKPFITSFRILIVDNLNLNSFIEYLEDAGYTINTAIFFPVTLRDLI